jgi:hypothetical protein
VSITAGRRVWDDVEAAPSGVIDVAQSWLVVADNHEFERRPIGEIIAAHEARRYRIPAGEPLDPGFRPGATLLGLGRGDQARTTEHGEVGGMVVEL